MDNRKLALNRKRTLALPLPILLISTLGFMSLGGGRGPGGNELKPEGINTRLPDPHLKKERATDKLSFYEAAAADSLRLKKYIEKGVMAFHSTAMDNRNKISNNPFTAPDSGEARLTARMEQLKVLLSSKPLPNHPPALSQARGADRDPLAKMLSVMDNRREPDPEIGRLGEMLDKIMMIQHPEKGRDSVEKRFSLSVAPATDSANDDFFSLPQPGQQEKTNTVSAAIEETGSILPGSLIGLRLEEDIRVGHARVPKGTLIYGSSALNNERLDITVRSIRCNENILPVALRAYDLDGQPGIAIPGSMNRDMAKQSSAQVLSGINPLALDPSIGAQAAGAGIEAARMMLSKKIRLVRVSIPVGYKVLLIDESIKPIP